MSPDNFSAGVRFQLVSVLRNWEDWEGGGAWADQKHQDEEIRRHAWPASGLGEEDDDFTGMGLW